MILQRNEKCKAPCHILSSSWHLLGLTDATLSCLPKLLSESARLTSKPRLWLAVNIEADGNWLHMTWVLQLKKVHSEKLNKFQSRNVVAIHICHSGLRQGQFAARDGRREGRRKMTDRKGAGLTAGWGWSWRTGWSTRSPFCWSYQGAWSMDGPESLSSRSLGSKGFALGSGSLEE